MRKADREGSRPQRPGTFLDKARIQIHGPWDQKLSFEFTKDTLQSSEASERSSSKNSVSENDSMWCAGFKGKSGAIAILRVQTGLLHAGVGRDRGAGLDDAGLRALRAPLRVAAKRILRDRLAHGALGAGHLLGAPDLSERLRSRAHLVATHAAAQDGQQHERSGVTLHVFPLVSARGPQIVAQSSAAPRGKRGPGANRRNMFRPPKGRNLRQTRNLRFPRRNRFTPLIRTDFP